jgi:hypothetical protein
VQRRPHGDALHGLNGAVAESGLRLRLAPVSQVRAARRQPRPNPTPCLDPAPRILRSQVSRISLGSLLHRCKALRARSSAVSRTTGRWVDSAFTAPAPLRQLLRSCCELLSRQAARSCWSPLQVRWLAVLPRLRAEAAALWRRQGVGRRPGGGEMSCGVLSVGLGAIAVAPRIERYVSGSARSVLQATQPKSERHAQTLPVKLVVPRSDILTTWGGSSHPKMSAASGLAFAAPHGCRQRIASGAHSTSRCA